MSKLEKILEDLWEEMTLKGYQIEDWRVILPYDAFETEPLVRNWMANVSRLAEGTNLRDYTFVKKENK